MHRFLPLAAATLLLVAPCRPARAQAWDSPSFLSPFATAATGGYLVEPDDGDWGVVGFWRRGGRYGFGLRGGIVEFVDDLHALAGIDLRGPLVRSADDPALAVGWTLGLGAMLGDATVVSIPAGVSVGARLAAGGFALVPYLHPRVAVDLGDGAGEDETDVEFMLDLGADLELGSRLSVLVGVTLGGDGDVASHEALGLGVAFRTGRGVASR